MPDRDTAKSKAEVEAELEGSSDAIQGRLDAIRDEIRSTGSSIRSTLSKHPLASIGGSLLAGALVGWLLAGVGKRRLSKAHRQLLSEYVEALRDEVREAVADGEEIGTAVQEALRNRAPLIVYAEDQGSDGWLRQTAGLVFDTALTLFIRDALSGFLDGLGVEEALGGEEAANASEGEGALDDLDTTSP